jgi:uncharacterized membrane protein YfcA
LTLAGLSPGVLLYCLAVVFVAALVRGYSGFGSSALIVTAGGLVLPARELIPIAYLIEIAASLGVLGQIHRHVARRLLVGLLIGAAIAMPLGLLLLGSLPDRPVKLAISGIVLAASLLLLARRLPQLSTTLPAVLATGLVSGLANGIAAVGGLPVVLYLLATGAPVAASRATLIVFLMAGAVYGVAVAGGGGLITAEVLLRTLIFLLPLAAGVYLGNRRFLKTAPDSFRRLALLLLIGLSLLGIARALAGW